MTCSRCSTTCMPKVSLSTAADAVLVVAARHGLGMPVEPVAVDGEAATVAARARFDHFSGFLARAVLDGVVIADDSLQSVVLADWHRQLLTCVRLEALAVRTAELLHTARIRWRLTKGAALAHLDYPDPSVRTFGDVDIVVHPDDWPDAFGLLTSAGGYRREVPTLPGGYDARYGKGATLTTPEGLEVDLHRRFAIGRFGVTSRMEELFGAADAVELAGRSLPVLDPPGRLLHACFHATLGGFRRLRAFRDVAQLLLVSGVDWETTFGMARGWRAEPVVARAVQDTWERLGLDVSHPAHDRATHTRMSRGDQRVLALFAREAAFRAQALSAVRRLPPHRIPHYLWSLGRPKLSQSP